MQPEGRSSMYEAGAARFFNTHKELISLMKTLGYTKDDWLPLENSSTEYHGFEPAMQFAKLKAFMKCIVSLLKSMDAEDLCSMTLRQALAQSSVEDVDDYFKASGYPHLLDSTAESALFICNQDYLQANTYYLFKPGLSKLVDGLKQACEDLCLNSKCSVEFVVGDVSRWRKSRGAPFEVSVKKEGGTDCMSMHCEQLVCAVPPSAFRAMRMPTSHHSWLNKVSRNIRAVPLLRQFAKYDDVSVFRPKLVTSTAVQRQYVGGGNIVQTSYSSGKNAAAWMRKLSQPDALLKLQRRIMPLVDAKSLVPSWTKSHFWPHGVHMWVPNATPHCTAKEQHAAILEGCGDGLWVCGEAFALEKRWIESALQSAKEVAASVCSYMRRNATPHCIAKEQHAAILEGCGDFLWVCGEAFALEKRWIESALQSANDAVASVRSYMRRTRVPVAQTTAKRKPAAATLPQSKKASMLPWWTMADVQKHKDVLVIDGAVYNVSKWYGKHPGGEAVLRKWVGKDATSAFHDVGHSEHAKHMLSTMRVASIVH
jgi:hypothetical protein